MPANKHPLNTSMHSARRTAGRARRHAECSALKAHAAKTERLTPDAGRYRPVMEIAALMLSVASIMIAGAAVVYTRRQAVAAERVLALEEAAAARYRPPWTLTWVKGDTFALTNDGYESVFDVNLTPPPHSAARGALHHDEIDPGSSETFLVAMTQASPHRNLTVVWRRQPDGEAHSWKSPLPANR